MGGVLATGHSSRRTPAPGAGAAVTLAGAVVGVAATSAGLLLVVRPGLDRLTTPELGAPSLVVVALAGGLLLGLGAAWSAQWERPTMLLGLAGATLASVLPLWSSWTGLPVAARSALLPLSAMVLPLLVLAVSSRASRYLVAAAATGGLGVLVHLTTYNGFHDLSCARTCADSPALTSALLGPEGTLWGLRTYLLLSAVAVVLSAVALARVRPGLPPALALVGAAVVALVADLVHLADLGSGAGPSAAHARVWPVLSVALVGLLLAGGRARVLVRRRRLDEVLRQLGEVDAGDPNLTGRTAGAANDVAFLVPDGRGRWVDVHGHDVAPPEVPGGVDVVVAGRSVSGAGGALTPARALALTHARLAAVTRSRLRAVRAAQARSVQRSDREQHRIERDLHDGAQQRLVAVRLLLASEARDADPVTAERLQRVQADLSLALDRLRELAHGTVPPVLHDEGLAAALEELALDAPGTVRVDLDIGTGIPDDVARTAYECAAAFVLASDDGASVRVTGGPERLLLALRRHGRPATLPVEVVDRIEAQGGRWRATHDGSGLEVELPCGS